MWIGLHEPSADECRGGRPRVRAAPAGGRGRGQRPPAPEARGLRRHAVRRAQDGALRRRDRGRRDRRDHGLRRRRLRGHRPPRRGASPLHDVRTRPRGGPRAARHRPERGALRDLRPVVDDYARSSTARRRHRRDRGARSSPASARDAGRADLQAQARGARVPPRGRRRWSTPMQRLAPSRPACRSTRARERRTSATSTTTCSAPPSSIEAFDELLTGVLQANLAQLAVRDRTRTCARSRPGSRSSPCRR